MSVCQLGVITIPIQIPSFCILVKAAVNHTRIRLGLSAANFQCLQYNFVDNMSCEKCGATRETDTDLVITSNFT